MSVLWYLCLVGGVWSHTQKWAVDKFMREGEGKREKEVGRRRKKVYLFEKHMRVRKEMKECGKARLLKGKEQEQFQELKDQH